MRVAYLVNQYPKTSHSFIRREIRALEEQGIQVSRFTVRRTDEPLATAEDREELGRTRAILPTGIAHHVVALLLRLVRAPVHFFRALAAAVRLGRRSDTGLLRHFIYLAEACVLVDWMEGDGAQHLHAHFGTNSAAVALLSRLLGGPPFSFTVHGPEEFDKPAAIKLGDKVQHAAFVVAISSYGRAQLCRWSRQEDWSKIHVVRCGVDDALLKAPLTAVPDTRRLACVARLSEQKGHVLLLEAASALLARGLSFELLLVGDGPMRGQLEGLIHQKGLTDRVRITGWMSGDQVRQALVAARALVLPSFAEGLPVVIMEALALGRPVVTTAIAGIPELVEAGRTGWLVPAGSVPALTAAVEAVLTSSSEQLGEMGRAGAGVVARQHDVNVEAARLADLFRQVAANGGSAAKAESATPVMSSGGSFNLCHDPPGRV